MKEEVVDPPGADFLILPSAFLLAAFCRAQNAAGTPSSEVTGLDCRVP